MILLLSQAEAKAHGARLHRMLGGNARTVMVGSDLDDPTVWEHAVAAGAEHVIFLPDAEDWLLKQVRALAVSE